MIRLGVDGTKLTVSINSGLVIERPVIITSWECNNELLARALLALLDRRLASTMEHDSYLPWGKP